MRKRIVRWICGGLAVSFVAIGIQAAIMGPRPLTLYLLGAGLLCGLQLGTFAVTGASPFRADRFRDVKEARAARRKRPNL